MEEDADPPAAAELRMRPLMRVPSWASFARLISRESVRLRMLRCESGTGGGGVEGWLGWRLCC